MYIHIIEQKRYNIPDAPLFCDVAQLWYGNLGKYPWWQRNFTPVATLVEKEEIWLSPMTKAPTPTENSKN